MVTVARGLGAGSALLVATLAVLATTVGLSTVGWGVGLACGGVTTGVVARSHPVAFGPADLVTLARLALACAVAALVAETWVGEPSLTALVGLAAVALVLDAADGRVARRTCTASGFGGRFDGEADAFLLLVLSVYVAGTVAPWVLVIGAARYVFAAAGWVWPWLRAQLPPRYWRKVVTAVQGSVLLLAVADVTPRWVTLAVLAVALGLLAESFGRDVVWLWRRRPGPAPTRAPSDAHLTGTGP